MEGEKKKLEKSDLYNEDGDLKEEYFSDFVNNVNEKITTKVFAEIKEAALSEFKSMGAAKKDMIINQSLFDSLFCSVCISLLSSYVNFSKQKEFSFHCAVKSFYEWMAHEEIKINEKSIQKIKLFFEEKK